MEMFVHETNRWWPRVLQVLIGVLVVAMVVSLVVWIAWEPDVKDGPGAINDERIETLNIAGDKNPEFIRVGEEVFAVPEAKTWFERWGAPLIGAIIAASAALAVALLTRQSTAKEDVADRLDRIERLVRGIQGQAEHDGAGAHQPTGPGAT